MLAKWAAEKEEKKAAALAAGLEWDSDAEEHEEPEPIEVIWILMLFGFLRAHSDAFTGMNLPDLVMTLISL